MKLQRRFLMRSRWTALTGDAERHFEVIAVHRDTVTMRAILTSRDLELEIRELDDATRWASGWKQL